ESIPNLKRIVSDFEQEKFERVLKNIHSLEKKTNFVDYYHFLSGQAFLGIAKKSFKKRQYTKTIQNAEKARQHFIQMQGLDPYSTLQSRAVLFLGESEVLLAETELRLRHRKKATTLFEQAFERYAQVKLFA